MNHEPLIVICTFEQMETNIVELNRTEAKIRSEGMEPNRGVIVYRTSLGIYLYDRYRGTLQTVLGVAGPKPMRHLPQLMRTNLEDILETGRQAQVLVDPRVEGVDLPEKLGTDPVWLILGCNMPKPIPDLELSDSTFSGTLSFTGCPYHVTVPWSAVKVVLPVPYGPAATETEKKPKLRLVKDVPLED